MTELEQLRQEVAALRKEVADLKSASEPRHYPAWPGLGPSLPLWPAYPGAPWPATCSGHGSAISSQPPSAYPINPMTPPREGWGGVE